MLGDELLNQLADEERKHTRTAGELEEKHLTVTAKAQEEESHRKLFLLQVVQPGLAGLMDGSVSTLAPLFAAAFATQHSSDAFRVGGIGHTLPFLISSFRVATLVAAAVVAVELCVISYVRHKYMDTPFLQATFQVVVGGVLVFLTGWLIGSS